MTILNCFPKEEIQGILDRLLHLNGGCPSQDLLGILDAWSSVLDILVTGPVIGPTLDFPEAGKGRKLIAQRMLIEFLQQHVGQFTNTGLIVRIADIDDLLVAFIVFIFNDPI